MVSRTRLAWALGGLLLQACGMPFDIKESCETGFYTTTTGKIMHWPDGHRIDFEMHKSVPAEMRDAVVAAGARYNDALRTTHLNVIRSPLSTPTFRGNVSQVSGDNINAIYWVREKDWVWAESDPHAVAMTVVSFSLDGIVEADVFYRAKIFAESSTPSTDSSTTTTGSALTSAALLDKVLSLGGLAPVRVFKAAYSTASTNVNMAQHQAYMVGVHEFGHALGLCHSESATSIMYPEVNATNEKRREKPLSDLDLDVLAKAYEL